MSWIDKTVDMLIKGKLKLPEASNAFSGRSVLELFDRFEPCNLREGTTPEDKADYELVWKKMLVKHFVKNAYEKMKPIFSACILKDKWEQTWYDFVVTQLYIYH